MPTKEQTKAQIHALFDATVPDGAEYTKVYAAEIRTKNYLVFQRTTVANFAIGFKPGSTDLVILPLGTDQDALVAGEPIHVTDGNRRSVKKRDLQGRFVIETTDGQKFRLSVVPSVPKITSAFYQLPVDQKAEWDAFEEIKAALAA
jgi:hypothetical protein